MVQCKARVPEMNAQRLCMDAKPTKRSFKGKGVGGFQGIVLIWKGWYGARDGVTIPPIAARIFWATAPHL